MNQNPIEDVLEELHFTEAQKDGARPAGRAGRRDSRRHGPCRLRAENAQRALRRAAAAGGPWAGSGKQSARPAAGRAAEQS